jgi:hypothetical protein
MASSYEYLVLRNVCLFTTLLYCIEKGLGKYSSSRYVYVRSNFFHCVVLYLTCVFPIPYVPIRYLTMIVNGEELEKKKRQKY